MLSLLLFFFSSFFSFSFTPAILYSYSPGPCSDNSLIYDKLPRKYETAIRQTLKPLSFFLFPINHFLILTLIVPPPPLVTQRNEIFLIGEFFTVVDTATSYHQYHCPLSLNSSIFFFLR